jgi:hypothetical protein
VSLERPIEAAEQASDDVEQQARNLIPWLENPYECDHCGQLCYAEEQYVESQALEMKVWQCRECDSRYYRE